MGQYGMTYSGHSLSTTLKNGKKLVLDFGEKAEVMCYAKSPDGNFLIYNLQKYRPNIYELVLHNLQENKEEWRYKYPQDQVIHELVFKGQRILAYSGPRPSAHVDRRYNFTLDMSGRLVDNEIVESQKQKEDDDRLDRVRQIMTTNLADIAPTIEVVSRARSSSEAKIANSKYSSIMEGQRPLPALYATVSHSIEQSKFILNISIIARDPQERDNMMKKCANTLAQKKEEFRKNSLQIIGIPMLSVVPSFRGGGSYFRAFVIANVTYPSEVPTDTRSSPGHLWVEPGEVTVDKAGNVHAVANLKMDKEWEDMLKEADEIRERIQKSGASEKKK